METLKNLIENIIGEYVPVTALVEQFDADGMYLGDVETIASGMAGVDWPWVIAALLFVLCIYSLFRLLGVFFKK